MIRRGFLTAAILACILLPAEGASPPLLRFPFWACSDGKGSISLFWLPPGGAWPAGGYRLERVSRGRATALGGPIRPGQDARAMMEIDPGVSDAIRALADGIERGTLTDEDRSRSVSVLGRAAAADAVLGRALGVRYTDVPRGRGKFVYRLTPLEAGGGTGGAMESAEVDPGKPTPAPGRPGGLRAEERSDGVALFWTDPPAGPVAPVVGYRVDRGDGGRRTVALTPKPLLLDRHLRRGEPEFLDEAAPAKKLTYHVRGIDVFGRLSAPAKAAVTVRKAARPAAPAGAQASAARAAPQAAATAPAGQGERGGASSRVPIAPAALKTAARAPMEAHLGMSAPATVLAPQPEPPRAAAAAQRSPEPSVPAAAGEKPSARQAGAPPRPLIVGIAGMADRVIVRFRPGEPEHLTEAFLVIRSESPTGTGVSVGRPIPGSKREWEDTTVSAGQYFWYRLVAVDGAGNKSEPSAAKWVSTGSR